MGSLIPLMLLGGGGKIMGFIKKLMMFKIMGPLALFGGMGMMSKLLPLLLLTGGAGGLLTGLGSGTTLGGNTGKLIFLMMILGGGGMLFGARKRRRYSRPRVIYRNRYRRSYSRRRY